MDKMELQEMLSALADGQLRGEDLEGAVRAVATDAQARTAWHTYHLIGDVLRSGQLHPATPPARFLAGFQVRLEQERPPLARELPAPAPVVVAGLPVRPQAPAANDGNFRWKLVAGCASLAAVAAVGWTTVSGLAGSAQPQLASAAAPAAAVASASLGPAPVMIRDRRLDEMLAAHRQFGAGASALQSPAGFLRNATFEGPAR